MTTIYLHIGMPKTGSTSLQKFLFTNREKLLRQGYLYPVTVAGITKKGIRNHNNLVHSIVKNYSHGDNKVGVWENIKMEINTIKPKNVIISAEDFNIYKNFKNSNIIALTKKC